MSDEGWGPGLCKYCGEILRSSEAVFCSQNCCGDWKREGTSRSFRVVGPAMIGTPRYECDADGDRVSASSLQEMLLSLPAFREPPPPSSIPTFGEVAEKVYIFYRRSLSDIRSEEAMMERMSWRELPEAEKDVWVGMTAYTAALVEGILRRNEEGKRR